jgi:Cupin-like domain
MSLNLPEIDGKDLTGEVQFLREVVEPCRPLVLRDLVSAWPAVHSATRSAVDLQAYLSQFDNGREAEVFVGDASIDGKYYYTEDLKDFNFSRRRLKFGDAVAALVAERAAGDAPTMYLGSVSVNEYLPGFAMQNVLKVLPPHVAPRIWLGHAAKVSAHFDAFDNIACVVAGRRRFTLFAPETIANLYVGPIDHTMAGQPVSLAAAAPPDDAKYPLFKGVLSQALSAELLPGDAIYIPKLWWHQIESLAAFNGLVNYWWDAFSVGPDAPYTSLLLSMISIAERPAPERAAWRAFFDHYVFRSDGHPLRHLPPEQHGMLGPLKPDNYAKIRAIVMHRLRGG